MLIFSLLLNMQSHPTWVRGLKLIYHYEENTENDVAPYVGAWIETSLFLYLYFVPGVAPYVGAWIETFYLEEYVFTIQSHPTWVRGLKLHPSGWVPIILRRTLRGCVD